MKLCKGIAESEFRLKRKRRLQINSDRRIVRQLHFRKRDSNLASRRGKIALLIDGANLHATAKSLGFEVDFKRLLAEFEGGGALIRAFFYTTVLDEGLSTIRPLLDWLDYNGFTVALKAKKEFVDDEGRRCTKGNMDIELVVDAMELADYVDRVVLFSGDGNFRSLVEALQRHGVRVTVVSSVSSNPPMIANELRRQADEFIDLLSLKGNIGRGAARASKQNRRAK
jgi:uncharacterized LabA/DUF88 family protein